MRVLPCTLGFNIFSRTASKTGLPGYSSATVCQCMVPRPAFCFVSLNITEKYIPKRVGARTQPCFTPFTMGKGPDIIPSTWAVPCIFSCNHFIRSSKIGGHPTFLRILKSASRFTLSKAFVRSTKATWSGICCFLVL